MPRFHGCGETPVEGISVLSQQISNNLRDLCTISKPIYSVETKLKYYLITNASIV